MAKTPASTELVTTSSARLTKQERALVDEALRRGQDLRDELESAVRSFGRWVLGKVFGGDTTRALDGKADNPVWREILRRAGGPTLPISRRLVYVAVSVAAFDKRIPDGAWRGLDLGRKELLLPLQHEDALREAAEHVSRFNLSQSDTWAYVTQKLSDKGKPRQLRLTAPRLMARVKGMRQELGRPELLRKAGTVISALDEEQRAEVAEELQSLRDAIDKLLRVARK
jgi:hypothetical protein